MRTSIRRPASVIHHSAVIQHKTSHRNPSLIETSVRKRNQPEFQQKEDGAPIEYLPGI